MIGDQRSKIKIVGWGCKEKCARVRHHVVIVLASVSTVTVLAIAPVRAQNKIGPAGVSPQARQLIRTKRAARDGLCEAPFPESAQQRSPVQSQATRRSGSVSGVVLGGNGVAIPGAEITLTGISVLQQRTSISGANGEFSFTRVPPGAYFITVKAKGFQSYRSAKFTLAGGQVYEVPGIQLSIAPVKTEVVIRPTSVIAQMQMKAEEKQRVLGVFPSFYTSYIWNAAPLDTKQKFSLSLRDIFDPVSLIGVAATAGLEQANNTFPGFGRGAAGYGRRFGAAFGDSLIGGLLSQAAFPSIFHQDPRYFYQGTGSVRSRLIHALSWSVVARSDSGRPMPNYADLFGDLAAGALSNLYYPPGSRGVGLLFANFGIDVASRAGDAVIQEFVLKRLTRHVSGRGKPGDP
jgi:hypothetical protein